MICITAIYIALIPFQFATSTQVTNSKFTPVNLNHECAQKTGDLRSDVPIILIHGMGVTKQNWDGVFESLVYQSGRKVCRIDLRNHGDSPWTNGTGVAAMSGDIPHLLDEIGAKKAVLVGHSLGGKVAIDTALNYAERIESIVVEDISPSLTKVSEETILLYWKIFKLAMDKVPNGSNEAEAKRIIVEYVKHIVKQLQGTMDDQNYFIAPFTCSNEKCHWKMNVDDLLEVIEKDFSRYWAPSVGLFEGPALFLYGTESPFKVGDHEDEIKKLFPNAKLVAFEGAGHSIHGQFQDFENEILKLVGDVSQSSDNYCQQS